MLNNRSHYILVHWLNEPLISFLVVHWWKVWVTYFGRFVPLRMVDSWYQVGTVVSGHTSLQFTIAGAHSGTQGQSGVQRELFCPLQDWSTSFLTFLIPFTFQIHKQLECMPFMIQNPFVDKQVGRLTDHFKHWKRMSPLDNEWLVQKKSPVKNSAGLSQGYITHQWFCRKSMVLSSWLLAFEAS